MRILKFIVQTQIITMDPGCDFSGIVSGTKGYLQAQFNVSKEWAGCRMAAVFRCLGKEYAQPVKNGRCEIPADALTWDRFSVRLVGQKENYRITTDEIIIQQERR